MLAAVRIVKPKVNRQMKTAEIGIENSKIVNENIPERKQWRLAGRQAVINNKIYKYLAGLSRGKKVNRSYQ